MQILTKKAILQKIKKNKEQIKQFGISRVGLFGSFAREEQKKDSDIDLMVEFKTGKKNFQNFIQFSEYAEKIFGKRVEVLTPQSVSPHIAPHLKNEVSYVQI